MAVLFGSFPSPLPVAPKVLPAGRVLRWLAANGQKGQNHWDLLAPGVEMEHMGITNSRRQVHVALITPGLAHALFCSLSCIGGFSLGWVTLQVRVQGLRSGPCYTPGSSMSVCRARVVLFCSFCDSMIGIGCE